MTTQKAKESRQVKKAREKLKRHLEIEHKKFTTEALQKMAYNIRTLLSRAQAEPITLRKRKISIFDENEHSVPSRSKAVLKLQKMLHKSILKTD